MPGEVDLALLVERAVEFNPGLAGMESIVTKELLHHDILACLDANGWLDGMALHGGTALRLCYGSSRLSEDLDFAAGKAFDPGALGRMADALKAGLERRYGLSVAVRAPKREAKEEGSVSVDTWQVSVITHPGRRDLPRQRVKIDVSNQIAHTFDLSPIKPNHLVLPSGYGDQMVFAMSASEIMANKLVSLPATVHRKNLRVRDVWDIGWLSRQGVEVNGGWVAAKVAEFQLNDYLDRNERLREFLPAHVASDAFLGQMRRFLPPLDIKRTLDRPDFCGLLVRSVDEALRHAAAAVVEINAGFDGGRPRP